MIRENRAMLYCCEDISNIENYELALNDKEQVWHCHHRGEILPCGRYSMDSLKKFGLYWNRPASELIFMTCSEHRRLHAHAMGFGGGGRYYWKGKHMPSEVTEKMSAAKKGKKKSENHKRCISEAIKLWWEKRKREKTLKV